MQIPTARLLLRDFVDGDDPSFLAYHADPRSAEFHGPRGADPAHAAALLARFRAWALRRPRRNLQLAIAERRAPDVVVGCIGLRRQGCAAGVAEFGVELAPPCWGRGLAAEAASALLAHGFDRMALAEIRAGSVSANARVARLLRRLGFAETGTDPGPAWFAEHGWRHVRWRVTREQWAHAAGGRHTP